MAYDDLVDLLTQNSSDQAMSKVGADTLNENTFTPRGGFGQNFATGLLKGALGTGLISYAQNDEKMQKSDVSSRLANALQSSDPIGTMKSDPTLSRAVGQYQLDLLDQKRQAQIAQNLEAQKYATQQGGSLVNGQFVLTPGLDPAQAHRAYMNEANKTRAQNLMPEISYGANNQPGQAPDPGQGEASPLIPPSVQKQFPGALTPKSVEMDMAAQKLQNENQTAQLAQQRQKNQNEASERAKALAKAGIIGDNIKDPTTGEELPLSPDNHKNVEMITANLPSVLRNVDDLKSAIAHDGQITIGDPSTEQGQLYANLMLKARPLYGEGVRFNEGMMNKDAQAIGAAVMTDNTGKALTQVLTGTDPQRALTSFGSEMAKQGQDKLRANNVEFNPGKYSKVAPEDSLKMQKYLNINPNAPKSEIRTGPDGKQYRVILGQ